MFFTIFESEKTPFQAIKGRSSKSQNIDIFSKGLTHGLGLKIAIFSTFFFLGNIGEENVFYDILERRNAFLGYKNKKFNKSNNSHFSKGVNPWFGRKITIFQLFFFQAIQARKRSFTIFQTEETPLQAIKTRSSKVEKLTFFQTG